VIAIDRFGISAPGNTVMKELGMTKDTVIAAAKYSPQGKLQPSQNNGIPHVRDAVFYGVRSAQNIPPP